MQGRKFCRACRWGGTFSSRAIFSGNFGENAQISGTLFPDKLSYFCHTSPIRTQNPPILRLRCDNFQGRRDSYSQNLIPSVRFFAGRKRDERNSSRAALADLGPKEKR